MTSIINQAALLTSIWAVCAAWKPPVLRRATSGPILAQEASMLSQWP